MMKYLIRQEEQRALSDNVVCFSIPFEPIPWKRPGSNKQGIRFDEQKGLKAQIANFIRHKTPSFPLDGCLELIITFYFKIPDSWSRKKKEKVAGKRKGTKPDNTNCTKFYEDLLEDMGFYFNDAQISDHTIKKRYDDGNGPRIEIIIRSFNKGEE